MAEERPPRLVDYFVIAGLAGDGAPIPEETWVPEPSGPLRPPRPAEPITDVAVIARALGEEVPQGYTCIQASAGGHPLELSAGLLGGTQPVICYRRGRDKPPLVELGCVLLSMLAPGEAGRDCGCARGMGEGWAVGMGRQWAGWRPGRRAGSGTYLVFSPTWVRAPM